MTARIGKTLGHYQITEKLGEGGMGVVYRARDTHLDRFITIKVLPPEKVSNPDRKRRFIREAKAALALNVPKCAGRDNSPLVSDGTRGVPAETNAASSMRMRVVQTISSAVSLPASSMAMADSRLTVGSRTADR